MSEEHFNRVIFRARNRFRELLEHRGFWKADLLAVALLALSVSGTATYPPAAPPTALSASHAFGDVEC